MPVFSKKVIVATALVVMVPSVIIAKSYSVRAAGAERVKSINIRAGGGKTKWIYFRNMSCPIGKPVVGSNLQTWINSSDYEKQSGTMFKHLSGRMRWIQELAEGYHINSAVVGVGEERKVQFYALFGVEVNEWHDGSGKLRYYARRPISCVDDVASPDTKSNVPPPAWTVSNLTRDDFVNPDDIDWMFDLQDFTKPALAGP